MAQFDERTYPGDWLKWEQDANYSREQVTIAAGQNLMSGAVVGMISVGGRFAAYDNGLSNGLEVAAGILVEDVNATAADRQGVIIARDAVVNPNALVYLAAQNQAARDAALVDLRTLGILARRGV